MFKAQYLQPDLALAQRHLTLLDEGAEKFVFQTLDDNKERKDPSLARTLYGTLDQHKGQLLNLSKRGAGVFVTVNHSSNGGRKKEDIDGYRAIFREADKPCLPPLPLEPHFIIESSPGKKHEYLLIDRTDDGTTWAAIMATMVDVYGSDPNAKDRSRVLRLAGFPHQKDPANPHMVTIVHESGAQPYSMDEVAKYIPPTAKVKEKPAATVKGTSTNYGQKALDSEIAELRATPEGSRNAQLNKTAFSLGQLVAGGELDQDQVEVSLMAAAVNIGLNESEARQTIKSGIGSGGQKPRTSPPPVNQGTRTPPAQTKATTEPTTDTETIQRLAALSPIEYDRIRAQEAERLKIKVGTLDKEVAGARKGKTENTVEPLNVEAWGQEINPGQLLSDIVVTVKRFIVCADETAIAVALWVAFTWFIEVVQIAPLAIITAPDKRCGKSILLFLLGKLVKRPLAASNISGPALFRTIDAWNPTLLVDEADAFMKENEELRGLFNCGHTRDSAYTIRLVGDNHEPKQFNVWGAKALAGIGKLADTMMDRAIVLNLRRKLPHETVDRLRYAEPNLFEELSQKLARFADDYSEEIRRARPDLPAALNDRAQDNWEPLLAIAEVAGGEWPKKAKDAALKMAGVQGDSRSIGVELLADIQTVFEAKKVDKISTVNLIAALCEDEEGPWATWNKGKQITPRQVSFRLSDYGISSKGVRIGPDTPKGFDKEQFIEAFSRYLSVTPLPSATPPQTNDSKGLGVADNPPRCVNNMQKATGNQPESLTCCAVADFSGGPEHTQGLEVFDL